VLKRGGKGGLKGGLIESKTAVRKEK